MLRISRPTPHNTSGLPQIDSTRPARTTRGPRQSSPPIKSQFCAKSSLENARNPFRQTEPPLRTTRAHHILSHWSDPRATRCARRSPPVFIVRRASSLNHAGLFSHNSSIFGAKYRPSEFSKHTLARLFLRSGAVPSSGQNWAKAACSHIVFERQQIFGCQCIDRILRKVRTCDGRSRVISCGLGLLEI